MALEKTYELDSIGIDKESGIVELSIVDEMNWDDEGNHLFLLQEKINGYLSFIESDEINEIYPQAIGRKINIVLYSKYSLPSIGLDFLEKACEVIEHAGYALKCFEWLHDNEDETGEWKLIKQ